MKHNPTHINNQPIHLMCETTVTYAPDQRAGVYLSPMDIVFGLMLFWAFITILIVHFNLKDEENGIQ